MVETSSPPAARTILLALLGLVTITGCATNNKALAPEQASALPAPIDPPLMAGDELEVRFYYAPELNTQQVVRADGKMSLQLVGDVQVAGLTVQEFSESLRAQYSEQLRVPEVTVIVRSSYARRVYVTGEVSNPGAYPMPGPLSVWEAVIVAGGFDMRNSDRTQIIVARTNAEGKRVGYAINLKDEMLGAASEPFMLQPLDIVYVPREAIVDVAEFIDKYINKIVPQTGFTYTRNYSRGTIGIDTSGN